MRRLIGFTLMVIAASLAGCKPAETLDDTTKLIYLAPGSPCEAGESGFGSAYCFKKRRHDALVVLRVPKNFNTSPPDVETPMNTDSTNIVLMPDKVLAAFELGDKNDYVKQEKIAYKNYNNFDPSKPVVLKSFATNWGAWTSKTLQRDAALSRMTPSTVSHPNGPYVEIPPLFPGFKSYDRTKCVDYVVRYKTSQAFTGQVSEKSTCDTRSQIHVPTDTTETYAECGALELHDGELEFGTNCWLQTSYPLRLFGDKVFYFVYTYYAAPNWLKTGDWKIVDKRVREWIKSIDVTEQYLQTGAKK